MAILRNDYPNKVKPNLFANDKFTVFYYEFTVNKKKYRGLINYTDKIGWNKKVKVSSAEMELHKIKKIKIDGLLDYDIKLDDYMIKHFEMLPDTRWKRTKISHYTRLIKPYIGNDKIINIRQMHIKKIIKEQEKMGLAPRTVKQTLEVLIPAFKDAMINRLIEYNPCEGIKIKLPKTKKIVSNAVNRLKEIYLAIQVAFKDDPFYKAFYLFALQGRRKSEILNLKWEDVSFDENYYILRDTKNDETQKMYLPNNIKALLLEIKPFGKEYVFTSRITGGKLINIDWTTQKLKKILGDDFNIHYMRNVVTSAMGDVGIEAIYQSGALGHGDLTTINKYSTLNYLKGSKVASDVISQITTEHQ